LKTYGTVATDGSFEIQTRGQGASISPAAPAGKRLYLENCGEAREQTRKRNTIENAHGFRCEGRDGRRQFELLWDR